jgi:hypothetical protein
MLNISKVVCMLLKHFVPIWPQSPIYRQHYAYKLVYKAYHKCMYTAQNTVCPCRMYYSGNVLWGHLDRKPWSMTPLRLGIRFIVQKIWHPRTTYECISHSELRIRCYGRRHIPAYPTVHYRYNTYDTDTLLGDRPSTPNHDIYRLFFL